jgi:hypothetical protein
VDPPNPYTYIRCQGVFVVFGCFVFAATETIQPTQPIQPLVQVQHFAVVTATTKPRLVIIHDDIASKRHYS